MPAYARMLGDEYDKDMSRGQIAEALRSGEAMPKVSFMLAVVLLETGAKIEGGSSQIVYARRIKEALGKVFNEAGRQPGFDREDIAARPRRRRKIRLSHGAGANLGSQGKW